MMKGLDKGNVSAFRYKYNFFKSLIPLQIDIFNPTYFTDWLSVKNPPARNARDVGLIPRSGRSPGLGNGTPL